MKLPELSTTEYGLIGHPLGHSRSRELFASWGKSYENFDLPELTPAALYNLVLLNPHLRGFNVTAPYKEAILPYLDRLDPEAARIGAANTVKINRAADGRVLSLEGYNTDCSGFRMALEDMLGQDYAPVQALILGTGGAAKAVAAALESIAINYKFVSRSHSDARTITYASLTPGTIEACRIIINATPLGTYPSADACPDIDYSAVSPGHKCFDLVYNPPVTRFMSECAAHGADVKNGLEMLENQARLALEIWNNE